MVAPVYIPSNSAREFPLLHILANICYLIFFYKTIFTCVKLYLTEVLIYIFLMINDVEILFMCLYVFTE